jgi:hypothetical protein
MWSLAAVISVSQAQRWRRILSRLSCPPKTFCLWQRIGSAAGRVHTVRQLHVQLVGVVRVLHRWRPQRYL